MWFAREEKAHRGLCGTRIKGDCPEIPKLAKIAENLTADHTDWTDL
jgi:hypothetical protein